MRNTLLLILSFIGFRAQAQLPRPMIAEFARLDVNRILLLPDIAIDYYPIWSPDNQYIGINVGNTWYKYDLSETTMVLADVRKEVIGYNNYGSLDSLSANDVEHWNTATTYDPRQVRTQDGYTYALQMVGLSTQFIETDPAGNTKEIFRTEGENNHSLSLSPDQKFIAFIAEMNGLMIYVRDKAALQATISEADREIGEALNLLDKNKIGKGQHQLEDILKKRPDNADAWFLLSQVLYTKENPDTSLQLALKAVELAPKKPAYLIWLSEIYAAKGAYTDAIKTLQTYLQHKPTKYAIYFDIATLYMDQQDIEKACQYYQLTRSYFPDFTDPAFQADCR